MKKGCVKRCFTPSATACGGASSLKEGALKDDGVLFRKLEKHSVYARTVMTTLKIWGKTSVTPTSPIPTQQTI